MDRRALLTAVLTIAGAAATIGPGATPAIAAAEGIDVKSFHDLLVAVTGYAPRDPSVVEVFFDAFSSEIASLRALSDIVLGVPESEWETRIAAAKLDALAQQLILAGYTGMVGEGSDAKVITYLNAFVWYACGYTKPPSQCDWEFGEWAYPPAKGRFNP